MKSKRLFKLLKHSIFKYNKCDRLQFASGTLFKFMHPPKSDSIAAIDCQGCKMNTRWICM